MQRSLALFGPLAGLCLAALPLGGCVTDTYGDTGYYSAGVAWNPYPYDVWYDDYYGPIYDGYWGGDGYFYYRTGANDRDWHRGSGNHFRHDSGGNNYHRYQGSTHQPSAGAHMPYYPGNHSNNDDNNGRHRRHR